MFDFYPLLLRRQVLMQAVGGVYAINPYVLLRKQAKKLQVSTVASNLTSTYVDKQACVFLSTHDLGLS